MLLKDGVYEKLLVYVPDSLLIVLLHAVTFCGGCASITGPNTWEKNYDNIDAYMM